MSSPDIPDSTSPDSSVGAPQLVAPFPSLPALHAAHVELIRQHRDGGATPELAAEADRFIRRGSAAGVLLDAENDREAAQGLLDYWATILYRAGHEPPDATLADFAPDLAPALDDSLCPYVGLDPFREIDHNVFFGRQRLIQEFVRLLADHRLLAVVGPSGSGKSSAVRAGLIPALHDHALPGSGSWRIFDPIVPGADALRALAGLFQPAGAGADWLDEQIARLKRSPEHLARLIGAAGAGTAVLSVDQFEEVFTLVEDESAGHAFIDSLLHLLGLPDAGHRVILTMRSDFEPFVARVPELQALFGEGRAPVTPLSAAELRDAIERPATLVGLKFEDGVVDALLHDLLGEPAALPLLQFTLLKLWESRQRNRVTMDAYRRLGGGRLALARSADEFYAKLIPEEQVTARRILLRMVRPAEGLEITSNRIRRLALYRDGEAKERIDRVLDKLIAARLVRVSGATPEDAQIEVAHEALVRNWPTLVGWLEDERAALSMRRRLEARADEWVRLGRGSGGLLDREQLIDAEHWLASPEAQDVGFDPALAELVAASRAAIVEAEQAQELARQRELAQAKALAEAQERRAEAERKRAELEAASNRRLTWLFRALAVMSILAIGFAIWATSSSQAAQEARKRAEQQASQLQTAVVAIRNAQSTAEVSRGLAEQSAATAEASRQLAEQSAARAEANRQLAEQNAAAARAAQATTVAIGQLAEQRQRVDQASLLAAVSHAVRESKPQLSLLLGVEALLVTQQKSEQPVVTATQALNESLISLGAPTRGLFGHTRAVSAVAISADGGTLLSGGADGSARAWDLSGATPAGGQALPGASAVVSAVAISPDGRRLIAAGADGIIHIWEARDLAAAPRDLRGPDGPIGHLLISPDGRWLVAGGASSTASAWRLDNLDAAPLALAGHSRPITDLAISADSRLLLTSSEDGTARLWDLAATNPQRPSGFLTTRPNQPALSAAALSPDRRWAVTAGQDGALHVWRLSGSSFGSGPTILNAGTVTALEIDPRSRWIVTGGADGSVRLWQLGGRGPQHTLAGHTGPITALVFSADGRWLATTSVDGTARRWDLDSASPEAGPRVLRGPEGKIVAAALTPDGRTLAGGGEDTSARVWDLAAAPPAPATLPRDAVALGRVACAAAGRQLTADEWRLYFDGKPYRKTCAAAP